jgi:muramoyltetrapeptide carboxypeptidase LdcA involved in peptidoglycan recycling
MKPLKYGDTIGIFSPSTPSTALTPKRYERAKDFLISKGFKLTEGRLTGRKDYYRSGTIEERAEELNALIRDKSVRCIIAAIGGMNSNSLLPYIDYEAFSIDPKIIVGLSDVTAILFAIYTKTGSITFYGPTLIATFGEMEPFQSLTYQCFEDILVSGVGEGYQYKIPEIWTEERISWESQNESKKGQVNGWLTLSEGYVEGRLIAGNLSTMSGIWGSPYMPEIQCGDILMIENCYKSAKEVERMYSHLLLNGVFDKIGGLIIGKHECFDDCGSGRKHYEILQEVIGLRNYPILAEVDCSHTHPMITLPIGTKVLLDSTNHIIELREDVFRDEPR